MALILKQKNNKNKNITCHTYLTRTNNNMAVVVPFVTKSIAQRSSYFLAPRIYNEVPTEIKAKNYESLLKKQIKKWLISKPRMYAHQLIDIKNTYYDAN